MAACESYHLKNLMGVHYDWNVEVIAQFYATLYIGEGSGARRMHWMTKGEWYNISMMISPPASLLGPPMLIALGFTYIICLMRVR
jgi:hypothetical protein